MRKLDVRIAVSLMAVGAIVLPSNPGLGQAAPKIQWTRPASAAIPPAGREQPSAASSTEHPHKDNSQLVSASWYVDSVRGKDTNSGQDVNHPFKTIGRLLASRIVANQTIALKAGSQWRETLTIPTTNVTVISYGNGQQPLLDSSDAVTSSLWSKIPGAKYVYGVMVPIDADPNITWVNVWENGNFLVRATSIANCDSTPGSYYPSADTGNGTIQITLYVHTSDGSNPARNRKLYEYSKRQQALVSLYPNVTVAGLWTRRNLNNNGSLEVTGMGSLVDKTLITDGGKHNAYISPGVSMTDVTLRNQYYASNDFIMVVMNGNGMPGDSTFTRVHAYSTVSTGVVGSGIGSHSNDGNPFTGTFTCIDCEVDNVGQGFSPGGWNNVVLTRPITSGTAAGVGVIGLSSTSITGGYLVALNGRGITNGGPTNADSSVVIENTSVTSNGGNAILLGAGSISITSSTITTADDSNGPIYLTRGTFVLTGNTVDRGTSSTQPFYLLPTGVSGTSDYNTFLSNATTGMPFWLGAEYSFTQWQGLGYDLHSTTP